MHAVTCGPFRACRATTSLLLGVAATLAIVVLRTPPAAHAETKCQLVNPTTQQCTVWVTVPDPTPNPTQGPGLGSSGDTGPACYSDGSNLVNQGPVPCQDNGT